MITERTLVKTDTDIQSDAQSFASHIGLAKAIKNYDLTRVISFHSRVSSARDFANKLPEVIDWMPRETKPDGELLTNHVSGAMPTNERNKNLQALGNITDDQRYILSNARCLSEGVDVPALDGVAFIDPRNSEIDIVQAVGRAIRLSKGKAIGSIVIPVFIEDHEDPDEVLNSSPFKKVWAVVMLYALMMRAWANNLISCVELWGNEELLGSRIRLSLICLLLLLTNSRLLLILNYYSVRRHHGISSTGYCANMLRKMGMLGLTQRRNTETKS